MTVKASKKAVPFMLMFAPKGSTNCATGSLIPREVAQRSVTGSVAMLESVPITVTSAVAKPLKTNRNVLRPTDDVQINAWEQHCEGWSVA